MNRTRALVLSLAVGVAAIAGMFAIGEPLALGRQASGTTDRKIATRTAQLDRYQASLQRALRTRPPALPPLPTASSEVAPQSTAPTRVVYHRPPPVVVTVHRPGSGEHEGVEADD